MRILAIENELPVPAPPNISELLRDEARGVWELTQRGIVRDIWFTAPDRRAVLTLECAHATEAQEHLSTLPLLQAGLIDFTILELRPYDGLQRLFAPHPGTVKRSLP